MNKQVRGYLKIMSMEHITIVDNTIMSQMDLRKSIHSVLLVRTKRKSDDNVSQVTKRTKIVPQANAAGEIMSNDAKQKTPLNHKKVTLIDKSVVTEKLELLQKLKEDNIVKIKILKSSPKDRRAAMLNIAHSNASGSSNDFSSDDDDCIRNKRYDVDKPSQDNDNNKTSHDDDYDKRDYDKTSHDDSDKTSHDDDKFSHDDGSDYGDDKSSHDDESDSDDLGKHESSFNNVKTK